MIRIFVMAVISITIFIWGFNYKKVVAQEKQIVLETECSSNSYEIKCLTYRLEALSEKYPDLYSKRAEIKSDLDLVSLAFSKHYELLYESYTALGNLEKSEKYFKKHKEYRSRSIPDDHEIASIWPTPLVMAEQVKLGHPERAISMMQSFFSMEGGSVCQSLSAHLSFFGYIDKVKFLLKTEACSDVEAKYLIYKDLLGFYMQHGNNTEFEKIMAEAKSDLDEETFMKLDSIINGQCKDALERILKYLKRDDLRFNININPKEQLPKSFNAKELIQFLDRFMFQKDYEEAMKAINLSEDKYTEAYGLSKLLEHLMNKTKPKLFYRDGSDFGGCPFYNLFEKRKKFRSEVWDRQAELLKKQGQ